MCPGSHNKLRLVVPVSVVASVLPPIRSWTDFLPSSEGLKLLADLYIVSRSAELLVLQKFKTNSQKTLHSPRENRSSVRLVGA